MFHKVHRKGPTRRVVIGTKVSLGLVDKPVNNLFLGDRFAVNGNDLARGDFGCQSLDSDSVEGNPARFDHFVALPTGAYARVG